MPAPPCAGQAGSSRRRQTARPRPPGRADRPAAPSRPRRSPPALPRPARPRPATRRPQPRQRHPEALAIRPGAKFRPPRQREDIGGTVGAAQLGIREPAQKRIRPRRRAGARAAPVPAPPILLRRQELRLGDSIKDPGPGAYQRVHPLVGIAGIEPGNRDDVRRTANAASRPNDRVAGRHQRVTAGVDDHGGAPESSHPCVHSPDAAATAIGWGENAGVAVRRHVITVARLDAGDSYKGVDTLVCAWPRVLDRVPEAELLVVGEGSARRTWSGSRAGSASRADPLPGQALGSRAVPRLPCRRCLRAAGAAELGPRAYGEGFGSSLSRLRPSGCRSWPAGRGAPEAIVEGVTGLLVDPLDPEDVAPCRLSPPARSGPGRRMGAAGMRLAAERFSYSVFRTGSVIWLVRSERERCREGGAVKAIARSTVFRDGAVRRIRLGPLRDAPSASGRSRGCRPGTRERSGRCSGCSGSWCALRTS